MPSPVNVRETRESCLRPLVLLSISTNATSPLRTGAILCLSLTASHSFKPYRFSPTPWEPLPKGTRGRLPGPDGGPQAPAVGESRIRRPGAKRRLSRSGRLGVLYAQSIRRTLTQSVLPRLLARIWSGLSFRRWIIIPRRVRNADSGRKGEKAAEAGRGCSPHPRHRPLRRPAAGY